MANISLTIGETIKIFRGRNGMSRKQLAQAIGVSVSTISSYENGVTLPDSKTLLKIAKILDVSTDLLLFDPDAENARSHFHRPKLTRSQLENMF